MGLHSIGMVSKMYADAIEQSDDGPPRALTAAGAGRLQRVAGGVLPQVLPASVAVGLHRLDINLRVSVVLGFVGVGGIGYAIAESLRVLDNNIRSATLLGIVGAGGIGFYLLNAGRVLEFGVVTTILLMIFATVMLVELLAIWVRSRW